MSRTLITIKLAGDSGDGIQLSGHRLAMIQALFGNDVATFADYPAEIRAPKGTLYGVSAYQIQLGSAKVLTPGDMIDILVALSPAAYQAWIHKLKPGGLLLVDEDTFTPENLNKIELHHQPLNQPNLPYRVINLPITTILLRLFHSRNLRKYEIIKTKNFFVLGVLCWLLERDITNTTKWITTSTRFSEKFKTINTQALTEGYTASLVREMIPFHLSVPAQCVSDGKNHRFINGNMALALGLIAATRTSHKTLFYTSYPITPASPLLHELAAYTEPDIITYQAEDEIAAIGAAIGAAYGGELGVVGTSGPGMSLMSEFIGLAVMAELPLVVIDVQRAGPSTGMPTKTSQGDLNLALGGRNDSAPVVVLAAHSPSDGFDKAYLAVKIATTRNCVVIILSDAYLANSHEIWRIPQAQNLQPITIPPLPDPHNFKPYQPHPVHLSVPWIPCGTKGYAHTKGGLEKTPDGEISYDGANHELMMRRRHRKVLNTNNLLPPLIRGGDPQATNLILSWGSTLGAIKQFIYSHRLACKPHERLAFIHLEALYPLQPELDELLKSYTLIMVLESNLGQATAHLRHQLPHIKFQPILKNDGKPWNQHELKHHVSAQLSASSSSATTT